MTRNVALVAVPMRASGDHSNGRRATIFEVMRKFLNYGRVFYHWRLKRSTRLPYLPEDISIELTNTCNFRCAFCPQSDPEHFNIVTRSTLSPPTCFASRTSRPATTCVCVSPPRH